MYGRGLRALLLQRESGSAVFRGRSQPWSRCPGGLSFLGRRLLDGLSRRLRGRRRLGAGLYLLPNPGRRRWWSRGDEVLGPLRTVEGFPQFQ